jgi:hypothetical protein
VFGGIVSTAAEKAYYCAVLAALRFIEQRQPTGRRFGPDADARWSSFRGDLTTADRIDLLVRDANAQWPGAFGARTVFASRAVAEDEPFGSSWEPLDPVDAEELWRSQLTVPPAADLPAALLAVAQAWELRLTKHEVGTIGAADKLLVSGPSAIVSAVAAFHQGKDLEWTDQVAVVATPPAHRQLAGLGGALLNVTKSTTIWSAGEGTAQGGRRLILSADTDPADAHWARGLAGVGR